MFVCRECADKYGFFVGFSLQSFGRCEACKETKECYDIRPREKTEAFDVPIVTQSWEIALERIQELSTRVDRLTKQVERLMGATELMGWWG